MSSTAQETLAIAAKELGYDRFKDPQQGTKYGRWWQSKTGSSYYGKNGVPFCAMFVSWVLDKAGVACPYYPHPVVHDNTTRLQGRKVLKTNLQPGDIVSFDWDGNGIGDHVGFVELVARDHIQTIEGNTLNGKVARRTRSYDQVTCGVRPYYTEQNQSQAPQQEPAAPLVVDGICGPLTVAEWQRQLGTPADGIISGQLYQWINHLPAIAAIQYNGVGSQMVQALQRRLNIDTDGYFGPVTIMMLQKRLMMWGYGVGELDGIAGPKTMRALQQSLNDKRWE